MIIVLEDNAISYIIFWQKKTRPLDIEDITDIGLTHIISNAANAIEVWVVVFYIYIYIYICIYYYIQTYVFDSSSVNFINIWYTDKIQLFIKSLNVFQHIW